MIRVEGVGFFFFFAELHQRAFSITQLVLESDSDTHSLEDYDISAQSGGNTDSDTYDITDINFTQWNDNTLSTFCTCSPQVYRGSEWVVKNTATPHQ
jgi:hypothetical protein